ncbi:MAG TPA: DUF192 domain-containing protein [Planctomycetota bacterium]|nr:DUF192 domain-containing protein [Planctomycetota bacterium]
MPGTRLTQGLLAAMLAVVSAAGEKAREPSAANDPSNKQDPPMICRNLTKGNVVASHLVVADTWEKRRKGFLGRSSIQPGEGMLLTPCFAIHMVGMKFALDVVFLDRENCVVGIDTHVKPGTLNSSCRKARSTLELPPGTVAAKRLEKGDMLQILRADEAKEKGAEKGEEK